MANWVNNTEVTTLTAGNCIAVTGDATTGPTVSVTPPAVTNATGGVTNDIPVFADNTGYVLKDSGILLQNTTTLLNVISSLPIASQNVGLGYQTLNALTTGTNNIAIGYRPLLSNTTGSDNIAIGRNSLQNSTTVSQNLAIGTQALEVNTIGTNNLAIGYQALQKNTTGSINLSIGGQALFNNTTGTNNLGIGASALTSNQTGSNNTAIGYASGFTSTGSVNQCTLIGASTNYASGVSNVTAIGASAVVNTSNSIVLGNGVCNVGIGQSSPTYGLHLGAANGTYVPQVHLSSSSTVVAPSANNGVFSVNNGVPQFTNTTGTSPILTGANKGMVFLISYTPCVAATTVNLTATYNNGTAGVGATLTSTVNAVFSVDGQNPALSSRILVKNQTTQTQNGIYTLTTVGTVGTPWVLTRAVDFDTPAEIIVGQSIYVQTGTVNVNTSWNETTTIVTIGTTNITFATFTAGVWNVPTGVTSFKVTCVGGGGGGGNGTTAASGGGGGGGGGTIVAYVTGVTSSTIFNYSIGRGGLATTAGTSTTLSASTPAISMTAAGGSGGGSTGGNGGIGGISNTLQTGITSYVLLNGGSGGGGGSGAVVAAGSSSGGNSSLGGGGFGIGATFSSAGGNGTNNTGGGGGGGRGTGLGGGTGGSGIIIIEY